MNPIKKIGEVLFSVFIIASLVLSPISPVLAEELENIISDAAEEVVEDPVEEIVAETPLVEEIPVVEEEVVQEEVPVVVEDEMQNPLADLVDVIEEFVAPLNFVEESQVEDVQVSDEQTNSNITFFEKVELGVTYEFSSDDEVQITFTKLPENPGSLSIEKIILSDEQVEMLGALSDVAYDITSDMDNGSFEYDLKLSVSNDVPADTKVVYAESVEDLEENIVTEVATEKIEVSSAGNSVDITSLDHFTIFVIVPNDIVERTLIPFNPFIQGWSLEQSGNANITLFAVLDAGIPNDFGSHVIKLDRTGGVGVNRSFLGYYEENVTLADIEEVKWNVYSKVGTDTYLNIYLIKINYFNLFGNLIPIGFDTASVVFAPATTPNTWTQHSLSSATNIIVREDGSQTTYSTFAELMSSDYANWDLSVDSDALAGIVIVSGSSSPTAPQEHYVDGITLKINGVEELYNFTNQTPDPEEKHQMSVSGSVYRDFKVNDCFNKTTCEDRGEDLGEGWKINLYKENISGDWDFVKTTQTNTDGIFAFSAVKDAGVYHVCEEMEEGWTQQLQTWSGSGFLVATDNLSGNSLEGPYCRTINYPDTGNYSNKFKFGNVDTQKPAGEAVYDGGVEVDDVIYIQSIDDLSFTETIEDNHSVVRATFLVQKLNTNTNAYEGLCGNWNANSTGSHVLGGSTNEVNTVTNIKDCSTDLSKWTDGTYKIFHAAYDMSGNEGKFNTNRQVFVIDSTAPNAPVHESPADNHIQNINDFYFEWTDVDDAVEYEFQSSQNPTTDVDGVLTTGVWHNKSSGNPEQNYLTDSRIRSMGANGTWFWQVRSIDEAGNKSDWTTPWEMTIDMVAPTVPVITSPTPEQVFETTPILNEWSASTDATAITYQIAYGYDDEHTFGGSTCSEVTSIDEKIVSGCRDTSDTSREHSPSLEEQGGVTIWVRAIDEAGNKSDWSTGVHYVYEVAPPVVIVKTESTVVVEGDTAAAENEFGWLFNRDTGSATPFEFNEDESSVGDGSLYVFPIDGLNSSDKFIAEFFPQTLISDLTSFSFDFKMGADSEVTDYQHVYLNVYANFGVSDDNKFYDCRYNVLATTGSTENFTTVTFDPTQAYTVTTRTGGSASPFTCPSIPADMNTLSPNSNIRAFAINLGDSSVNDEGVNAYFDNVVLETTDEIVTYDLEAIELPPIDIVPMFSSVDSNRGRSGQTRLPVGNSSQGEVLGATTGLGDTCGTILTTYMREGANNDSTEVSLLQTFLTAQGFTVPSTGFFGSITKNAVIQFQNKFADEILKPWGVEATGNVYKTTRWKINNMICPGSEAFPIIP
jgi:hypothetical protein